MGKKHFFDLDDDTFNIGLSDKLLYGEKGFKFRLNDHMILDEETSDLHFGISIGDTEDDEE